MTQFHEGQEVEVWYGTDGAPLWHKAKIVNVVKLENHPWCVELADGSRELVNADHIRAVEYRAVEYDEPPGTKVR
jgi:hypothetical protein